MTRKIIGLGETVLDIVFREGQPQAAVPGGSVFNSMISLGRTAGRLSPEIRLLMESQVGDDAEVFSPGVHAAFPTAPIKKVVSTIGAGDNFNAGIIYGLVRNAFSRQDVKVLRREDWEMLVPVAMKFSANVCGSLFNYVDTDFADSI